MIAGTRFVLMLTCQFDEIVDGVIGGVKQPGGHHMHGHAVALVGRFHLARQNDIPIRRADDASGKSQPSG